MFQAYNIRHKMGFPRRVSTSSSEEQGHPQKDLVPTSASVFLAILRLWPFWWWWISVTRNQWVVVGDQRLGNKIVTDWITLGFVCLLIPIGSWSSHVPLWARITCWWFVSCKHFAVFTPQEIAEMNLIWWEIFRVGWFSYPEELACLLFTLDIQNHPVLLSEECTYNIYICTYIYINYHY